MVAVLPLIVLAAMIAALVDIIMRDESQVRHLPKFGWLLLVILLPLIGTLLWFTLGREYGSGAPNPALEAIRADRTRRSTPAPRAPRADARSTEEQLAELDREIEYYRRRAELERRKREVEGEAGG